MAEPMPRNHEPLPLIAVRGGQAVLHQGEACPGLWVVETGALLAEAVTADGRTLAFDVLGPGDLVGEPGDGPVELAVRSLRPCRLRPVAASMVAELLATRARRASQLALELAWLDVGARVRLRLADLSERFGREVTEGTLITVRLTQDDVAALAGTSRESANRALRELMRCGRVSTLGRGRYVVRAPLRPVSR